MEPTSPKSLLHNGIFLAASRFPESVCGVFTRDFAAPFYHSVTSVPRPHLQGLYTGRTPAEFERDIDSLMRHYTPIDLQKILTTLRNGGALPKRSMFLSFDDGLRDAYEIVAPLLRRKGAPATFFIATGNIDNRELMFRHKLSLLAAASPNTKGDILSFEPSNSEAVDKLAAAHGIDFEEYLKAERPYLTSDQISKLLSDGFTIGGHTVTHPHPDRTGANDFAAECIESVKVLRQRFGLDYGAFAFPFSDTRVQKQVFEVLRASGAVDVTFGTSGFRSDSVETNIQRIAMERPGVEALQVIAGNVLVQRVRKLVGKGKIER